MCNASEVWGFHDALVIERVQLKFCKTVLVVKSTVQNDFIYGELNRLSMKCVRLVDIVRYWLKIVHGEKITLCHEVLYECLGGGKKWWKVLGKLSESYVGAKRIWGPQGFGDREIFLKIFKQRVLNIFRQNWRERLSMSSRAMLYRSVKEKWVFSEYLEIVHVTEHRKAD